MHLFSLFRCFSTNDSWHGILSAAAEILFEMLQIATSMSSAIETYTTVIACKPADLVLAAWSCCVLRRDGAGTDGWTAALVLIMPIKPSKISIYLLHPLSVHNADTKQVQVSTTLVVQANNSDQHTQCRVHLANIS
jgi:hypothetical protein